MKVHVSFTDNIMDLTEATKWAGKGFEIAIEYNDDFYTEYTVSIKPIEIETLEELTALIKLFGTECIISNMDNGKDIWLEIYNSYRE